MIVVNTIICFIPAFETGTYWLIYFNTTYMLHCFCFYNFFFFHIHRFPLLARHVGLDDRLENAGLLLQINIDSPNLNTWVSRVMRLLEESGI